jgi:hypothetical protein
MKNVKQQHRQQNCSNAGDDNARINLTLLKRLARFQLLWYRHHTLKLVNAISEIWFCTLCTLLTNMIYTTMNILIPVTVNDT